LRRRRRRRKRRSRRRRGREKVTTPPIYPNVGLYQYLSLTAMAHVESSKSATAALFFDLGFAGNVRRRVHRARKEQDGKKVSELSLSS